MKIGKLVFAAMFAIGFGSSCACAQTASAAAQTTTASTATFTAVVAGVNTAAGTISLTQALAVKPTAVHDSATATADYLASPVLLNKATVGATVRATVQRVNGSPAVTTLQTPNGVFSAIPQVAPVATNSASMLTPSLASNPVVSNPARLTPVGAQ